jgi:hypothetical protein
MAKTVQDDARERQIADWCGLQASDDRAGIDARDDSGNPLELKSATKKDVTTARDVGLHTIDEWRRKYWIVAKGRNEESGFKIEFLYIAHPDDLEPRFRVLEERLADAWNHCQKVLAAARDAGVDAETVSKVQVFCERGVTRNNPKIPLRLFEQNATKLDCTKRAAARRQVAAFVKKRPIGQKAPPA